MICAAEPPPQLRELYEGLVSRPSDINEHLPRLRELASQCDVVAEFGTRWGASTAALLAGQPEELWTYDVDWRATAHAVTQLGPLRGRTRFRAVLGSSLEERLPRGGVDLLFVDSLHTYAQLAAELRRHGDLARRWIVFHDTVTYGAEGEDGRQPGLMAAIEEFRDPDYPFRDLVPAPWPRWKVLEHRTNNNGLLVLERV